MMPKIKIHPESDFQKMRAAGHFARRLLDHLEHYVGVGTNTYELNEIARNFILDKGAESALNGYMNYPADICTSLNDVVCHGIPSKMEVLQDGDILKIDVAPKFHGWFGDTCRVFRVGQLYTKTEYLCRVTYEALWLGIQQVKPGNFTGDIGHAIQTHVEHHGYSVVRDYTGHGVGEVLHGFPIINHIGKPGTGIELKKGMFFTIEPMVNAGSHEVKVLEDGWTVVTKDGSWSAQYEHSVGVTETGCEIFTL
jgi:methionyl aminopeptidase